MFVKKQWGIGNVPFWHYLILIYKNAFQVIVNSLWAQTHENTPQTTVNTCVGHQKNFLCLILTDSWILVKILEPNFQQ